MNDREMLEWAAKAAGYGISNRLTDGGLMLLIGKRNAPKKWNPLTDDGDALRLAVRLFLTVKVEGHECEVFNNEGECLSSVPIMGSSCFTNQKDATNQYAATRRAIVRAAASIGNAMEG